MQESGKEAGKIMKDLARRYPKNYEKRETQTKQYAENVGSNYAIKHAKNTRNQAKNFLIRQLGTGEKSIQKKKKELSENACERKKLLAKFIQKLAMKVDNKTSKELDKKAYKETSTKLGIKVGKKPSKELGNKIGSKNTC